MSWTVTVGSNTRIWIDPCVAGKVAERDWPGGCPCDRCATVRLANALLRVHA